MLCCTGTLGWPASPCSSLEGLGLAPLVSLSCVEGQVLAAG